MTRYDLVAFDPIQLCNLNAIPNSNKLCRIHEIIKTLKAKTLHPLDYYLKSDRH